MVLSGGNHYVIQAAIQGFFNCNCELLGLHWKDLVKKNESKNHQKNKNQCVIALSITHWEKFTKCFIVIFSIMFSHFFVLLVMWKNYKQIIGKKNCTDIICGDIQLWSSEKKRDVYALATSNKKKTDFSFNSKTKE